MSLQFIYGSEDFFFSFCETNATHSSTINRHQFHHRDLSLQQSNGFELTPQTFSNRDWEMSILLLNCNQEHLYEK
jgi:hypothetical protein